MIVRPIFKYLVKNYCKVNLSLQGYQCIGILKPKEYKLYSSLPHSSSKSSCYVDKDPAPYFFNEEIQLLLRKLTGFNMEKIFKNVHLDDTEQVEEYKFYTKKDLEEHMNRSSKEAMRLLHMPPVVKERVQISEKLAYDPALQNPEITSKLVITDISYGATDRNRIIVVRDPDGTLRKATWEERDRMNQVYNPRKGRYIELPPVFQEENLKDTLKRQEYLFILDFACAQFEPDDPNFHEVTSQTYDHISETSSYDLVHSTRYFGPMCFYFAWCKKVDPLLIYYINRERIDEAVELIRLYYFIHDQVKFMDKSSVEDRVAFIKNYSNEHSGIKSNILLAVQAYEELVRERMENEMTVKHSHGVSQSPSDQK